LGFSWRLILRMTVFVPDWAIIVWSPVTK
jgi:hypothetical protein